MHPIEGEWKLESGKLQGFTNPCRKGTLLILLNGELVVKSDRDSYYKHCYEIIDSEEPPELHCREGSVTYSVWTYKIRDDYLELVYSDPGMPGRPVWAGFPRLFLTLQRAMFRRID